MARTPKLKYLGHVHTSYLRISMVHFKGVYIGALHTFKGTIISFVEGPSEPKPVANVDVARVSFERLES